MRKEKGVPTLAKHGYNDDPITNRMEYFEGFMERSFAELVDAVNTVKQVGIVRRGDICV